MRYFFICRDCFWAEGSFNREEQAARCPGHWTGRRKKGDRQVCMRLEPVNSWWKSNLSQQKKQGEKEGEGNMVM